MDYGIADNPGFFNTPGVLLTEAVIFAAGGSHIELGEHMLGKEYFPNGNLYMKEDLKKNLVNYYDFLVAYENLLRDSINYKSILVASENYSITATQHAGSIWQFAKEKGNKDIIHLINFINASSLKWNDAQGTQPEPNLITNLPLTVTVSSPVKNVWMASPDSNMGSPVALSFKQDGDKLIITAPYLKYWSMIVIEYDSQTSVGYKESGKKIKKFSLEQNYPNPFNPVTNISFLTAIEGHVSLKLYDLLGKEIAALIDEDLPAGAYNLPLSSEKYALASGVYFYRLTAPGFTSTKKCILNK